MQQSLATQAIQSGHEWGKDTNPNLFSGYGDLLTMEDCGEIAHQSTQTMRALCRKQVLPSVRIGRRLYVPKALFIEYIQSQLVEA